MKHIVLVEDDAAIKDIFQLALQNKGYTITSLDNGDRITSGEIESPDLFVLDRQLSGANGLDICRFIKTNEKYLNVPVIMLSANPDIVTLAIEAGAEEALTKPFSLKKLRETILKYFV